MDLLIVLWLESLTSWNSFCILPLEGYYDVLYIYTWPQLVAEADFNG